MDTIHALRLSLMLQFSSWHFFALWIFWVRILAQRPVILTEVYHLFSKTLQASTEKFFVSYFLTAISAFIVPGVRCCE
jgi:hypothetical protein